MSNLVKLKEYTKHPSTQERMVELLDKNAPAFLSSLVSAVGGNSQLQKCEPESIMSAAFVAAALKLPIDPNLGFSYIIPYGTKAQYQIGYKGFIQLAIRSGQYKSIHVSEVYSDELEFHNPITGEIKLTDLSGWKERYEGKKDPVGFYARIELITGFVKEDFKTRKEVENHAKKYSQTFKKGFGVWKDDFNAMAKKTVLKLLLSKFGILSTELQTALVSDQKTDDGYTDNPNSDDIIEAEVNPGADLISALGGK
jgi:recombination protein RecT